METPEERTVLTVEEFKKMTNNHDMPDAEAQEQVDSIIRFAEILLRHMENKGEP